MARHAVFTIVQSDPVNLETWALYYRRTYGAMDTFVLHHPLPAEPFNANWIMSVGLSIADEYDDQGFMLMPGVFREESFDHTWLRETVQAFQRFLLQSYDTVLFTEVDEIVAPVDTKLRPYALAIYLRDFASVPATEWPIARCTGYEVVHDYAVEPPLDFGCRPLLKQRTYWYPTRQYSKPLLSKVPLTWTNGFHSIDAASQGPFPDRVTSIPDPDSQLLLLHLHKLDFGHALKRHEESAARKWAQHDIDTNQGLQNRVAETAWLRGWWLNTVDSPYERARWEKMPDAVKEIV